MANLSLRKAVFGGGRTIAIRFVLPFVVIAIGIVLVHQLGVAFGVEMTERQIARLFWLALIVTGVIVGVASKRTQHSGDAGAEPTDE